MGWNRAERMLRLLPGIALCGSMTVLLMLTAVMPAAGQENTRQPAVIAAEPAGDAGSAGIGAGTVGIVDVNMIMQRAEAMKKIRAVLNERNADFQDQIAKEELALRQAERDLEQQRNQLSETEFNRRLAEFDQRVVSIQRAVQGQKQQFERAFGDAQQQLRELLFSIISEIAIESGLEIIMLKQNVVFFNTSLDISNQALERLNQATRNIKITFPAASQKSDP